MIKIIKISIILLLGSMSLFAQNIDTSAGCASATMKKNNRFKLSQKELNIMLPKLSQKELNIMLTRREQQNLKVLIKYGQSKKSFDHKKFLISFASLLKIKEQKQKMRNLDNNTLYLPKNKALVVQLTVNQYQYLLNTLSMQSFIQKLNDITNLNLTSKIIYSSNKAKIIYVGNYTNAILDSISPVEYVRLVNGTGRCISGIRCSSFEKAFNYFINFNGQKSFRRFNLSSIQIMNLYIKLLRWNVNISSFNSLLLNMFQSKTQYLNNFNFKKAFYALKFKPSFTVANKIKNSLLKIKNKYTKDNRNNIQIKGFVYNRPEKASAILLHISKIVGHKYILNNQYSINPTIPAPFSNKIRIKNFKDFKRYLKNNTKYSIKVMSNNYIINAPKIVVIYKQMDMKHQALHYLNLAIKEATFNKNKDFAKKAFINSIESIKREY